MPYKKAFDFKDIKSLEQTTKKACGYPTGTFSKTYIFTERTTSIKVVNGKVYKTNSLLQSEYEILLTNLRKIKSGQTIIKSKKNRLSNYLFENFDGIIWLIFCLVVTILLVYNFNKKQ